LTLTPAGGIVRTVVGNTAQRRGTTTGLRATHDAYGCDVVGQLVDVSKK
jgi:hypothetical protein